MPRENEVPAIKVAHREDQPPEERQRERTVRHHPLRRRRGHTNMARATAFNRR